MRRQLLGLVVKDLRVFRADRRAVIVTVAVPAVLALLFGSVFGGSGDGERKVHIKSRVVDLDRSPGSARLVDALARDPLLAAGVATQGEAEDLVRRGTIGVAVVIPSGFVADAVSRSKSGASPEAGRPAITLLSDASSPMEASIAQGEVQQLVARTLGPDLGPDFVRLAAFEPPFTTSIQAASGPEARYDGASHSLAGMGVQFILIGAVDSAVMLLTERQRGLFRRVRAAPISRGTLIASRLLSGAIIALFVTLFLYAFGAITMGIRIKGSLVGFGLVAVTFALMASSLGVLISTFGKTPQATRGAGIFIILIATMLSGAWFPAFLFPPWLQSATLFVPSRWAVDGLDAMTWRGLGLGDALAPAGVLLLSALVFAALAVWRFRWDD